MLCNKFNKGCDFLSNNTGNHDRNITKGIWFPVNQLILDK